MLLLSLHQKHNFYTFKFKSTEEKKHINIDYSLLDLIQFLLWEKLENSS